MNLNLIGIAESGLPDENVTLDSLARSVCEANAEMYKTQGFERPWIGYLAARDATLVGTCAFKSPPVGNAVEIAYFTFPGHENQGIAREMAQRLIALARERDPELTIVAQTLPAENASTTILRRLGFQFLGAREHLEDGTVWHWELHANDNARPAS